MAFTPHRSFVDQFHEEVFNRKRIAKNYVWRRDRFVERSGVAFHRRSFGANTGHCKILWLHGVPTKTKK